MFTVKIQSFWVDEYQEGHTKMETFETESFEHDLASKDSEQTISLPCGRVITLKPSEYDDYGRIIMHDGAPTHVFIENSNGKTTDVFRQYGFDKIESGE